MSCGGGVHHATQNSRGEDGKMAAGIAEVRQLQVKHFLFFIIFYISCPALALLTQHV